MSQSPLPLNALVCVISARRYGDAIIHANFLRAAANVRPDIRWIIWTKPEFTPLFELMGFNNVVTSEFPIAGGTPKAFRECGLSLIKAIYRLRKISLNASIDFIGDSREALLGCLITGSKHRSPRWSTTHWMHKLIWSHKIPFIDYTEIDNSKDRIYKIISGLLSQFIGQDVNLKTSLAPISNPPVVAFQIFPSASFREWPMENWALLANMLNLIGITPIIFCANVEKNRAEKLFKSNKTLAIRACSSIQELSSEIEKCDLVVGLDSFLIHLASAMGKRTISLVAGHLPHWWSPDGNIALGQSGGCSAYPCANQPTCLGKSTESECIKSISPSQVMHAIIEAFS